MEVTDSVNTQKMVGSCLFGTTEENRDYQIGNWERE